MEAVEAAAAAVTGAAMSACAREPGRACQGGYERPRSPDPSAAAAAAAAPAATATAPAAAAAAAAAAIRRF